MELLTIFDVHAPYSFPFSYLAVSLCAPGDICTASSPQKPVALH